jgi:hypothetical protein
LRKYKTSYIEMTLQVDCATEEVFRGVSAMKTENG